MKKKSNASLVTKDDDLEIPPTPLEFFETAEMGRYYKEYKRGRKPVRAVTLEEDVAAVFKDSKAVNGVLRAIIKFLPPGVALRQKKSA